MEFNHAAYQRRLDELKGDVRGMSSQFDQADYTFWHKDVSLRYGRWLAMRTQDQLQRAIAMLPNIEHVDDKMKHRAYCAQELMGVVAGLHASSAMIRGAVLIDDPVGAEAMMRIYDEANAPRNAKAASADGQNPTAVEAAGSASESLNRPSGEAGRG
jgi:hypothetical protein